MSEQSMSQLERAEVSFLAGLVGESVSMEKMSSYNLARERVRLLGLLAQTGVGGGGVNAIPPHSNVTVITPSLASSAAHEATADLGLTYIIRSLSVDKAARVQGYTTVAARTADAGRAFGGAFPAATAPYTVFDAQLPHEGALSVPVNLLGSGPLYLRITNTGTTAQVVTVNLDRTILEAVA